MPAAVTALLGCARWARRGLVLLALLLVALPALAQSDPFPWNQPPAEHQLAADETVIPLGKGALFVPTLTDPLAEPPVILVDDDDVRDIPSGERVILDPGQYTVIVSSGSPGQGIGQAIDVVEGETTLVPVKWGALRIEVVDEKRVPHRGTYEIIRADTREPYGTGFGADTLQGEQLITWVLPPGVYRIVKPGANYRALRDFATVYVPEAGFVRYRLVTDPETGEFRGAGVLLPGEFGSPKSGTQRWFTSLILGIDGSLDQQTNVVGFANQVLVAGSVFLDGQIAYARDNHRLTLLAQVEEGASQIRPREADPLPFIKSRDRLRGDLLYTWFFNEAVGPYARVAAESQAFATDVLVTEDTQVAMQLTNGTVVQRSLSANDTLRVSEAWAPSIIREGAGLNTRLVSNRWITLNWRAGLGLRQNRFGGAFLVQDDPSTPAIEYMQVASFDQRGIESTIVATARLPGWAVYATNVELFTDFSTLHRPSVEWRNTLALRLTRNLSLNYYANIDLLRLDDDATTPSVTQVQQSLLLRASWALF